MQSYDVIDVCVRAFITFPSICACHQNKNNKKRTKYNNIKQQKQQQQQAHSVVTTKNNYRSSLYGAIDLDVEGELQYERERGEEKRRAVHCNDEYFFGLGLHTYACVLVFFDKGVAIYLVKKLVQVHVTRVYRYM